MARSENNSTVPDSYHGRELALIKHSLLETYLEKLFMIIGMSSTKLAVKEICYVDCFAGPTVPKRIGEEEFSSILEETDWFPADLQRALSSLVAAGKVKNLDAQKKRPKKPLHWEKAGERLQLAPNGCRSSRKASGSSRGTGSRSRRDFPALCVHVPAKAL